MASTSEYLISGTIGEGSFGVVVHARHKTTGLDVAIKCMDKNSFVKHPHHARLVVQEQQLLKRLKETNGSPDASFAVNLYASFHDAVCVYLVTECCTGGTLQDVLAPSRTTARVGTQMACFYGWQLVQALWYLHTQAGIVHCDVKPANALLTDTGRVKLADFGSALDMNQPKPPPNSTNSKLPASPTSPHVPRGTAAYSAPELIQAQPDATLTPSVDLWSLGCILFALLQCDGTTVSSMPASSPFDCQLQEMATVQAIAAYCIQTSTHTVTTSRLAMLFGTQSLRTNDAQMDAILSWRDLIVGLLHPLATERLGVSDLAAADASPHVAYPSIRSSLAWHTADAPLNDSAAVPDPGMLPPVPAWWTHATSLHATFKEGNEGWSAFLV